MAPPHSSPTSGLSLQVITGTEQLSVAEASAALQVGRSARHWISSRGGQEITGGVVSLTVIVWMQLAWLPQLSVAV